MTGDICAGCGREISGSPIACPGCGRAIGAGEATPPGWGISAEAAPAAAEPRWRLAGIETARPVEGPNDTMPRTPAEIFKPAPSALADPDLEAALQGGPGWHIRPQRGDTTRAAAQRLAWQRPAMAGVVAGAVAVDVTRRAASRMLYWALVAGILITSSAAVALLALHMVRSR
jgi:hypothetical protein